MKEGKGRRREGELEIGTDGLRKKGKEVGTDREEGQADRGTDGRTEEGKDGRTDKLKEGRGGGHRVGAADPHVSFSLIECSGITLVALQCTLQHQKKNRYFH